MKLLRTATLTIVTATSGIFAQKAYDKLPKVAESSLAEQIESLQMNDPTISPAALAAHANKRLTEHGYDFTVDPCDMKTTATTIKYPSDENEVFHVYKATDAMGKAKQFLAREPGDAPCGCWLNLPVTAINRGSLVLVTGTGSLKLKPPSDFLFEEVFRGVALGRERFGFQQGLPDVGVGAGVEKVHSIAPGNYATLN